MKTDNKNVCVIGGCGHVGLPLAIAFASKGLPTYIYDTDDKAVEQVSRGEMPFMESGAEEMLKEVIGNQLHPSASPEVITNADIVIVTIGTPVDRHLSPDFMLFKRFIQDTLPHMRDGQTIVVRSTVYPGTTEWLHNFLKDSDKQIDVTFCPERIAEGKAMEELFSLPQIISAFNDEALAKVDDLFGLLTDERITLDPLQAELAKLFTNSWRYIQFAVANQFYMLANDYDTDFYEIFEAMKYKYPRAKDFPTAGFAAGPCLFKDTMQLSSFSEDNFYLGHSAMLINEGLPNYIVQQLKSKYDLDDLTVGILGMAFKANSDDKRSSLSYKLRKILNLEAKQVLCTDVYIENDEFVSAEELTEQSDIIIVGSPHNEYKSLEIPDDVHLVDVWNFYNHGGLI